MRDQLIKQLIALGYDEDDLSLMDDIQLKNELAKAQNTTLTPNAISQGGQTPESIVSQNSKSDFDKARELVAANNSYGQKLETQQEQLQNAKAAEDLRQQAEHQESLGVDTSNTGTPQEYENIRDNNLNARQTAAKANWQEQENERQQLENGREVPEISKSDIDQLAFSQYVTDKGEKGSGNRDYLIADAIATYLRNMGKDFNNIAAAYTGGTMNNEREESLLHQRTKQMAQAETEEQILRDNPMSRLGQELTSAQIQNEAGKIANMNSRDQRMFARAIYGQYFDKDGKLKVDPNSAAFKNGVTLANQLMSGGGAKESLLSQFCQKIFEYTKF